MKTAISIPDALNRTIEEFLRTRQMSRSEFFQRAAQLYLDKISAEVITANLDNVYGEPESLEDVAFRRAVLTHFRELSKTDK